MFLRRTLAVSVVIALASGCATTIAPSYQSTKPDVMRIGGDAPENPEPTIENTGSFCLQSTDKWHEDGETPDGQTLWAKDTARRVVPCQ